MNEKNLQTPHWNEAELLDLLYGLDAPAGKEAGHLERCAQCAALQERLSARRAQMLAAGTSLEEHKLRRQRERIWQRVEESHRPWIWRAVPAVATALMLTIGIGLNYHPAPSEAEPRMTLSQAAPVSDDQFFSEIASFANSDEPASAATIRNLFDVNSEGEAR
jgi:hypothetical protein